MRDLGAKARLALAVLAIVMALLPALDHRFGCGNVLVAVGFYLISLVYRENTFASATIQIAENQKVIATGPYAIVRHPMYASGLLYLLGTPLALGSYCGLLPIAWMLPFLIWRLLDEERLLARNLPGYAEYRRKVRCRFVPFVW